VREREFQTLGDELLKVWAPDICGLLNLDDLEDMDRPETSTVSGGHILIEGLDGIGAGKFTILLVHVVSSAAGVVADPDSKVLDFLRTLLMDHIQRHNLTSALFDLPELLKEIPEAGFSDDSVGGEEAHAVQLWSRIRI